MRRRTRSPRRRRRRTTTTTPTTLTTTPMTRTRTRTETTSTLGCPPALRWSRSTAARRPTALNDILFRTREESDMGGAPDGSEIESESEIVSDDAATRLPPSTRRAGCRARPTEKEGGRRRRRRTTTTTPTTTTTRSSKEPRRRTKDDAQLLKLKEGGALTTSSRTSKCGARTRRPRSAFRTRSACRAQCSTRSS